MQKTTPDPMNNPGSFLTKLNCFLALAVIITIFGLFFGLWQAYRWLSLKH